MADHQLDPAGREAVIGELSFDEKGDVVNPGYVLYVWEKGPDGKYVHVEQSS